MLTADYVHTEPVLTFLEAGVAVFVEKPLAIRIEDCDAILAAAAKTGTRLFVGHNLRHLPVLRRMRALIDEGVIGAVTSVWCRHFVGHGGAVEVPPPDPAIARYFEGWRRAVAGERYPTGRST